MAEENLNIRIGADNAIAVASIRQLQAIIRDLEERLAAAAIQAASTNAELAALGQKNIATYQAAIAEVNQQIAAQRDEVGAIRATTTALREQEAAATGASRAMAGGAAIIAAQQRASAAASAATTIAPRAIGGGAGIIAAQQRASAAAEREALAERNRLNAMSTRLQDAFAAEQLRTVAKQNEINRLNERAQAAFAAQEQRAARGAPAQPIRALEQGRMEALAVPMTAANLENLEYNRRLKFRAEQEREALDKWRLINTFNQRVQAEQDKAAIRAPEGRIAAATSPGVAAGEAAARATIRGAPPEVVSRVSNEAAMAALARQEQAIKAVAAARMAAAAAGASASEVELAAIGAVTLALRGEGTAAQSSGIAGFFQREIRHIVGLFDSLARGQRGQAISSIGAAARDAGLGVSTLVTSMGGLIALMGTAAILRGAESMGRWARETRALGVATGMTTQQVSGIQAVLTSFGMKADEADASIQHFAKQLAEALADPTSQAAQAFDNLNVKYADLKRNGQDVYGALLLLANGLAITEGGAYQAANAAQLLGNSDRHLIEALQDGADTFRKNVAEQEKMGRVLHDNTGRALEEAGDAVEHLTKKVGGDATQAFERWSGVLKTTGQVLETLSGIIFGTIGLVGKLIEVLGEAPAKAAQATAEVTRALTAQAPPSEKAVETVQARSVMAPGPPSFRPFGLTAEQEVLIKGGATPAEARAKAPGFSYGDTHHPPDLPSGERPGPRVKPVAIPATGFYGEAIPKLPAKPLIPKGEMPTEAEKAHLREVQAGLVAANAAKTTRAAREADDKAEVASLQARVTAAKAAVQATGKDPAKDPSKEQIIAETDLATKMKQLRMQTLADQAAGAKSATAAAKQAAHQSYEEFAGAEKLKISEAQGSSSKIIAIYDEWLQAVSSTYRQGLTLLRQYTTTVEAIERAKVQAVTAARLQEIKEGARLEEQQNRLSVVMGRAQTIAAGGAAKQPEGGTAALAAEASQIEANAQKEVAALMSVMTTAAKGSSVQKEAAQEVLSVVTQAKTQEIELYNKAAEAAKKAAASVY